MAWISFVVVVLIFYAPLIGLGRAIQEQAIPIEINIELLSLSLDLPYSGYIRLLLYSIGSWLLLWGLLLLLEGISKIDLLSRIKLRNRMLYALRPYVANNIALGLARLVLGYTVVKIALTWADQRLGALLPYDTDPGLVVLSVFALIVGYGFGLEQRRRYEADIRRNQRRRKSQQTAIVVPAAQE